MKTALFLGAWAVAAVSFAAASPLVSLEFLGRHATGLYNRSAAEIVAYDGASRRAFVANAAANTIDVLDLSSPANPTLVFSLDITAFGGGINSVAVSNGVVAAAVEAEAKADPGAVVFFDTDGNVLNSVTVGVLPDMVTFTPDGRYALTANEGEPEDDYLVDPEGSVSVIDLTGGVANASVSTATFAAFNAGTPAGVRVFGPGATTAQDLEPEYVAVSPDSSTAFVVCQENNALAIVDIATATVTDLVGLGYKDHALPRNRLDASDRDGASAFGRAPSSGSTSPTRSRPSRRTAPPTS
jgi:DNA-binding beta-propeller fold protein YncE